MIAVFATNFQGDYTVIDSRTMAEDGRGAQLIKSLRNFKSKKKKKRRPRK